MTRMHLSMSSERRNMEQRESAQEAEKNKSMTIEEKISSATVASLTAIVDEVANISDQVRREALIGLISKKFNINKRNIQQFITKSLKENQESNAIVSAKFGGLIDLAIDASGNVMFVVYDMLEATIKAVSSWSDGYHDYVPPKMNQVPYLLPRVHEILKWYSKDNDRQLFQDILRYFDRFCYVSRGQALIVASNVFASYLQDHGDIGYLPIIYMFGLPERGKTRIGKAATFIAFRGVVLNGLRDSHIIRLSEVFGATIFVDLRSAWSKVVAGSCDDILLGRFEKGHQIMRVISPEKGPFEDSRFYESFGPTFLASNVNIDKILGTRCLSILMKNRPGKYEKVQELSGRELRERLVAWRARTLHLRLPEVDLIPGVEGRIWDISEPLLQICQIVSQEAFEELKQEIVKLANEKRETKSESFEATIIKAIRDISDIKSKDCELLTGKLLSTLNLLRIMEKPLTSQYLGLKLKSMGISTKRLNGYSIMVLKKSEFDRLVNQYGTGGEKEEGKEAINEPQFEEYDL